jgi:hypothetical protein
MTLRAVTIAAGAVFELVRAVVALPDVRAERGGAACGDVAAPVLQEFLSVLAEDIGDFQPIRVHRCRTGSAE